MRVVGCQVCETRSALRWGGLHRPPSLEQSERQDGLLLTNSQVVLTFE